MDEKLKRATYHLWTFAFSKFISSFGNSIYVFAMSLFILTMTGSAMNFAINMICTILPRTILAPFAGYIADRFPKKRSRSIVSSGFSFNRFGTTRLYDNEWFIGYRHLCNNCFAYHFANVYWGCVYFFYYAAGR